MSDFISKFLFKHFRNSKMTESYRIFNEAYRLKYSPIFTSTVYITFNNVIISIKVVLYEKKSPML